MKSVLTLIAARDKQKLEASLVESIVSALKASGAAILAEDWLAADEACDIVFGRIGHEEAERIAREAIGEKAVDCLAQDTAQRQKRLLISDMDSTIITVECIDEIAGFAGVKDKVAGITERAMRGEIDFVAALAERVALLEGLEESVLQAVYEQRVKYMPGARELVATMRAQGAYAVLVSGGFDFFTSRVQGELGFHAQSANRLEIRDARLTGKVVPPVLDRQAKLDTMMQVSRQKSIGLSEVLAVGDGANDLPMITAAGLGVAYHAKPVVQQAARARINHCDLRALLYLQGYREEEIVGNVK